MPSGEYVRILAQDTAASQEEYTDFVQYRRNKRMFLWIVSKKLYSHRRGAVRRAGRGKAALDFSAAPL